MNTEMGEYIVGAYLKVVYCCDFVDYNVRPPGGGLEGLNELDVLGLDFKSHTIYLCEVTTHIGGLLYKDNKETIRRIGMKYQRMKEYASKYLDEFPKENRHFMFWSPVVPKGARINGLRELEKKGLELVINEEYLARINELKKKASITMNDVGNPFFRVLQILEHLRT